MDKQFEQQLRDRVRKGVSVFNKYIPEWRDMVRSYDPSKSPDIIESLFGFSSKYDKSCIIELYRRISAGRRSGNARAAEQMFFHDIGICLYPDESGSDHEELMGLWREAMEDPSLEDIRPPAPRAYFHTAERGGVCCRWNGNERGERIGFPEKFGPQPKDGECWEVIGESMNPNRTVYFLKLGKRIEDPENDLWKYWH